MKIWSLFCPESEINKAWMGSSNQSRNTPHNNQTFVNYFYSLYSTFSFPTFFINRFANLPSVSGIWTQPCQDDPFWPFLKWVTFLSAAESLANLSWPQNQTKLNFTKCLIHTVSTLHAFSFPAISINRFDNDASGQWVKKNVFLCPMEWCKRSFHQSDGNKGERRRIRSSKTI